jgi:glycerophosphoryl diester phosphodiesterase
VTAPLGFAHRGASATGIETDVWLTADHVPVLHHGERVRRRPIGQSTRAALPARVPTLRELYDACGTDLDLSLDLKDGRSVEAVLEVARSVGHDLRRLWLCGGVAGPLAWRAIDPTVRLVAGSDPRRVPSWRDHVRRLGDGGIDGVNVRRGHWTRELVDDVHAAGLLAFGWDAQSRRRIRALLALGCDAVYSDHADRLVREISSRGGARR